MTSILNPTYAVTLGSQQWTEQAITIDVRLEAAPRVDSLTVRLPAAAPLSAAVGDPVELTLGSGEKEEKVFTGAISSIQRGFQEIRVTALDAGGALARFRPAATYEKVTAGTVIRNLAGDAGVDTGEIEDGVELAFYVADPSRTALEHLARVGGWSGALVSVSADNAIEARVIDATQAQVALRYGRELIAFERRQSPAAVDSFVVAGEGGAGSSSAPGALRPTTDFFAGNRPDGPSLAARWRFEPALRTASGAATAGAALQRAYASSRDGGWLEAFLQPDLRPGTVLEVQDPPEGLPAGPLWICRAHHRLGRRGAFTRADYCQGGDSFDPLALLGSLGGLL